MASWVVLLIWWLWFRKKQDWRAILLYWFGGVFLTDLVCAAIMILFRSHIDEIISALVLLMPFGGFVALCYGAAKGRLNKGSGLFAED